ncbi:hypothetical protein SAMN04487976_11262 [Xaviernesmea oryzae]|nr:hypothetical protein SAMN04487976_11262 [Xaviernesmea oryzae]
MGIVPGLTKGESSADADERAPRVRPRGRQSPAVLTAAAARKQHARNQAAANFTSLIASKFWMPPPTRLVV